MATARPAVAATITAFMLSSALVFPAAAPGIGDAVWAERRVGPGTDFVAVAFRFDDIGGALDAAGNVWLTDDDGRTWERFPIITLPTFGIYEWTDLDFSGASQYGYIVGRHTVQIGDVTRQTPVIYFTEDGGRTWTSQSSNIAGTRTEGLNAVYAAGSGFALAVGDDGLVLYTRDYGDTWDTVAFGQPGRDFLGIEYSSGQAVAVGVDGDVVAWPYDWDTDTWGTASPKTSGTSADLRDIAFRQVGGTGVAIGDGGAFSRTTNTGNTWSAGDTGDHDWRGADGIDNPSGSGSGARIRACATDGSIWEWIYTSADGWSSQSDGTIGSGRPLEDLTMGSNLSFERSWAVGPGGVVAKRGLSSSARVAGSDRYATGVALSQSIFERDSVDTVVLATGLAFPDALAASGLAGAHGGPLLLVGDALNAAVEDELARLGATDVVIVGGAAAVPNAVSQKLGDLGYDVARIAGSNRYDTARLVAGAIASLDGAAFSKSAFVVRGDDFADALAVSPFAYSQKAPVLLTRATALSGEAASALSSLDVETAVIAGGTSAVGAGVQAEVTGITTSNGGAACGRWAGSDRFGTSAVVAESGITRGWGSPGYVGFATGLDYPDALGGGAVAGSQYGVLLLTRPDALPAPARSFLSSHEGEILEAVVFGGPAVVEQSVVDEIESRIR